MKLTSMLKPAFAALGLGFGLTAFAAGEVTLYDGSTIAWAEFVNALNGGVTGEISGLPQSNTAKQAYDKALNNKNKADSILKSFNEDNEGYAKNPYVVAVNEADSILKSFTNGNEGYAENTYAQRLATAQAAVDAFTTDDPEKQNNYKKALVAAQNYYNSFDKTNYPDLYKKNTYAKAIDSVQAVVDAYNGENGKIAIAVADTGKVSQAYYGALAAYKLLTDEYDNRQDRISKLKDTVSDYRITLNGIPGQIILIEGLLSAYKQTSDNKTIVEWLDPVYKAALKFEGYYDGWLNYDDEAAYKNKGTIYYRYVVINKTETATLYLAFGDEAPATGQTWESCNEETFWTKFVKKGTDRSTVDVLYVYVGSQYTAGSLTGYLKPTYSDENYKSLITTAVAAITTLTNTSGYYTTNPTTSYTWSATTPNGNLTEDEFNALMDEMDQLKKDQISLNTKIKNGDAEVARLQGVNAKLKSEQIDVFKYTYTEYDAEARTIAQWQTLYNTAIKAVTDLKAELVEAQTDLNTATTNFNTAQEKAEAAVTTAQSNYDARKETADNNLNTAQDNFTNAKSAANTALGNARTDLTNAESDAGEALTEAETDLANAEHTAQEAANEHALTNYKNVTLNSDVTVTATITKNDFAGGKINGNGKIINANVPLFSTFAGNLNTAAVNGTFASTIDGGKFGTVIVWANGSGRSYDEDGTRTNSEDFAALAYANRTQYGVNFANNTFVTKTPASTIYSITVNEAVDKNNQYFVTSDGSEFTTNGGATVTIPANRFAACANADIAGNAPANVYYGVNNTCEKVKIVDGDDFYCPVNVIATEMTFNRSFKSGFNSVCLPFSVQSTDDFKVYTYDINKGEEDGKFWFTETSGTVPANTPMLLKSNDNLANITLSGVAINAATTKFVKKESQNGGMSFGVFATTNVSEFLEESQKSRIFGLKNGEFHPAADDKTPFSAFRMAIASNYPSNQAPRKIGIRDEFGNDITDQEMDGIESVAADATSLSVTTAQGQIIFTSEADYGTVQVYGIDGRVAANATVMAGTTAIDVPQGMYIVLGKKVLVK